MHSSELKIRDLFNNKKFIFIFTFSVEFIFYYLFEELMITGNYLLGDLWLAPIFGLMFGPVGALGQASATLVWELGQGIAPVACVIDFGIMFFISVFTYKLWYTTFKRQELTSPKFDSIYNVLKFISIMIIMSIVNWILINISLLATPEMQVVYPLLSDIERISYVVNIFAFSLLGLLLISSFNILKIPMQTPRKIDTKIDIPYKYYVIIFLIVGFYLILDRLFIINNEYLNNIFFLICIVLIILFCLNKQDETITITSTTYSIIEQIIIMFLLILSVLLIFNFALLKNLLEYVFPDIYSDYLMMIVLAVTGTSIILLSLIHIYYVEKNITNPLYSLITSTKEYDKNKTENTDDSELEKYLINDNEIGTLVKSFLNIKTKIRTSLDELEKTTAENKRIETELNVASNIQTNMLPKNFDEFSKNRPFEIYGFMSAAKEVGGDFYDFFTVDEDHISFVIGDVSGKGMPATLFMVKTMNLIRNNSVFRNNLSEVFENVNNTACERNNENLFVTSWIGKLNLKNGKLTYVNAGHNRPLISQNNGNFEYLNKRANLVLGIMEDMPYKEHELYLSPGDMVFLYTDGLTEANDNYNEFYGNERLKTTINKHKDEDLNKIVDEIIKDMNQFCNYQEQFDDTTILILRYTGDGT